MNQSRSERDVAAAQERRGGRSPSPSGSGTSSPRSPARAPGLPRATARARRRSRPGRRSRAVPAGEPERERHGARRRGAPTPCRPPAWPEACRAAAAARGVELGVEERLDVEPPGRLGCLVGDVRRRPGREAGRGRACSDAPRGASSPPRRDRCPPRRRARTRRSYPSGGRSGSAEIGILTTIPASSASVRSYVHPRSCVSRKPFASAPAGRSTSAGETARSGSSCGRGPERPGDLRPTSTNAAQRSGSRRARPGLGVPASARSAARAAGRESLPGERRALRWITVGRDAHAT